MRFAIYDSANVWICSIHPHNAIVKMKFRVHAGVLKTYASLSAELRHDYPGPLSY